MNAGLNLRVPQNIESVSLDNQTIFSVCLDAKQGFVGHALQRPQLQLVFLMLQKKLNCVVLYDPPVTQDKASRSVTFF